MKHYLYKKKNGYTMIVEIIKEGRAVNNYDYEIKEVYASRGDHRIYGLMYIPQTHQEKLPTVIYSHGFGGSHLSGEAYAKALAAKGFVVYCYDFCGGSPNSKSDGKTYEMSIFSEKEDLEAVISMIKGLDYVDTSHLYLLGASQGGVVSAITANSHKEDIQGMVLLYPAFVLVDDAIKRFEKVENVPERYFHMSMEIGKVYASKLFDYDVYKNIKDYDKEVLILHGDQDNIVPLSYSKRAIEVYPNANLIVIPNGSHGFKENALDQAINEIIRYFQKKIQEEK